ncbi:MAG: hypothetical protein ACO2XZ_04200 [Rickettsiales bacterium]
MIPNFLLNLGVSLNNTSLVNYAISLQANVNQPDRSNFLPLDKAIMNLNAEIASLLIDHNAIIKANHLIIAITNSIMQENRDERLEIIARKLIETKKIDINFRNNRQYTALTEALSCNNFNIIPTLFKLGLTNIDHSDYLLATNKLHSTNNQNTDAIDKLKLIEIIKRNHQSFSKLQKNFSPEPYELLIIQLISAIGEINTLPLLRQLEEKLELVSNFEPINHDLVGQFLPVGDFIISLSIFKQNTRLTTLANRLDNANTNTILDSTTRTNFTERILSGDLRENQR